MMSTVRTTLTLDDDVAERLAQLANEMRLPFKVVVNETLRRGLADQAPSALDEERLAAQSGKHDRSGS
jgi:predicted transcriptional regulator